MQQTFTLTNLFGRSGSSSRLSSAFLSLSVTKSNNNIENNNNMPRCGGCGKRALHTSCTATSTTTAANNINNINTYSKNHTLGFGFGKNRQFHTSTTNNGIEEFFDLTTPLDKKPSKCFLFLFLFLYLIPKPKGKRKTNHLINSQHNKHTKNKP